MPIADRHLEFAEQLKEKLVEMDVRVEIDSRPDRLPAKIRAAQLEKVPHMLVIGDQEVEANKVNLRVRDGEQESLAIEDYLAKVVITSYSIHYTKLYELQLLQKLKPYLP